MDFLKRQLFMIVCGVVAAGSIALGVVGINAMSEVQAQMDSAAVLAGKLPRLSRDAANKQAIDAQQQRIDVLRGHYEQVLEWAYQRNRLEPLLPDSFPDPDRDRKRAFRDAYFARFDALLEKLGAGTVATADEIADAAEQTREEAEAGRAFGVDRSEAAGSGPAAPDKEKPLQFPSGLLTDHGAQTVPEARANLIKARGMHCYARRGAFEIFGGLAEGIAPEVDLMWDAQLSLWVQESVVDALARANERVAEELRQAGQAAWVGVLPVKELISIRTSQYVIEASDIKEPARPSEEGPAYPSGAADEVFTHNVSGDLYEVVQFTVKLVMDARMIPTIVDEVCRDNFHTPLRVAYDDVSSDASLWLMKGKIYGSQPTVRVVMDFETVFFGELYRPLMPDEIREALGLPAREE